MLLSSVRSAVEQLLLPAECLICHGLLNTRDAARIVCPLCRQRWRAVRPPWCERCGQPEPHFGPCRLCNQWPAALKSVRSAAWLDHGARLAVHGLKYVRERGYNQSEKLARALARQWRIPVLLDVLVRTRETPTQTALTPGTRLANVRAAFAVANVQCSMINDHSPLIVVDDVFTTGATLAEAARALEQAGATRVMGVTFARAAIPDFT